MASHTMSGFAAWYIEVVLGGFVLFLVGRSIWERGVPHGKRVESEQQVESFDAFMNDGFENEGGDIVTELYEMYNRPSLFDQDEE